MDNTMQLARKAMILLLSLAVIAGSVSCSNKQGDAASAHPTPGAEAAATVDTSEAAQETAWEDDLYSAMEAYREILVNADKYDYGASSDTEALGYRYALVHMYSGDTVPTLLIAQSTVLNIEYVRVFRYDTKTGTVSEPILQDDSAALMQGEGSAGGFRGEIMLLNDGSGLCASQFYSGTGEGTMDRVTGEGDTLTLTALWSGVITDAPDIAHSIGDWRDLSGGAV